MSVLEDRQLGKPQTQRRKVSPNLDHSGCEILSINPGAALYLTIYARLAEIGTFSVRQ